MTLLDGREFRLSGRPDVGKGNRGVFVHDPLFGRVLISWDAFERVEFSRENGPSYDDFSPGRPLTGEVITRDGRRLAGRLVYDLDESETTETLDAPSQGVNYAVLFGRVASIETTTSTSRIATVTLHSGEQLLLDRAGDLGDQNAGMLIFVDGQEQPEYVSWSDVERIDFDPPQVRVYEAEEDSRWAAPEPRQAS